MILCCRVIGFFGLRLRTMPEWLIPLSDWWIQWELRSLMQCCPLPVISGVSSVQTFWLLCHCCRGWSTASFTQEMKIHIVVRNKINDLLLYRSCFCACNWISLVLPSYFAGIASWHGRDYRLSYSAMLNCELARLLLSRNSTSRGCTLLFDVVAVPFDLQTLKRWENSSSSTITSSLQSRLTAADYSAKRTCSYGAKVEKTEKRKGKSCLGMKIFYHSLISKSERGCTAHSCKCLLSSLPALSYGGYQRQSMRVFAACNRSACPPWQNRHYYHICMADDYYRCIYWRKIGLCSKTLQM